MPVTSTTLAGVNVWQLSGAVTDAELRTAWAGLITNNRYLLARAIYIDNTCSLVNVRGTYYIDSQNLGVILHLSRNKANTLFRNWFFTQTVGLSVGARSNFVRFTNGTTITNSLTDGIDMQGGGMMYAVVGNPGGGDPRFLNEMMFGSLDGTLVTSAAWTEQEIEPNSIGTIWRGLNIQKAAGYPILGASTGLQRQVIYRSNFNTEGASLRVVRPYFNNSLCYVSSVIRRQGAAITANLLDTFGSSGAAVIMALNNWTDESWFGASKTTLPAANWNAGNRVIGGVLKKIQVQPSTLIRTYDSRSTTTSQKSTFSETTNDFLTGPGTTNLLLHSEAVDNAAWEKGLITVTANNTAAPDGTTTADRIVETTGTGQHRTSNVTAIGVIPATAHTFSFYAKPSGRNHVHARIISGGSATDAQACFNLVSGTFIVSAGTTATITDAGNDWFRCTISAVLTNNSAIGYVNLAGTSSLTVPSYAGNATLGVFLWGMQLQEGATATQYLQTTTSRADGYYSTTSDATTGRAQIVSVGAIGTGPTLSVTRFTGQRFTLQKFGFRVQVETPDMTFGDDDLSAFSPITMAEQTGLVRTEAAINAATALTQFQDLLEELHVLAIGLSGSASYAGAFGGNLANYAGDTLTTTFTTVNVDPNAAQKISFDAATNALTIRATVLTSNTAVARWVNSGAVNLLNGAQIQGVYSSGGLTSKIAELTVSTGSSIYIGNNATAVTRLYQNNVGADTYRAYYAPSATPPTVLIARELYGSQRFAQVVTLADGVNSFTPVDIPDVGISEPTLATVLAYTELVTDDQRYDRVAAYRLGEEGIKLGQIVTRSGTSLEWQAPFSVKIKKDATLVFSKTGNVFTFKALTATVGSRYNNNILPPPATFTADTDELITTNIDDANGDASVTIAGGDNLGYKLWKVPATLPPEGDETTGTLLDTVQRNDKYRFIGVTGFDIIGVDNSSGVRRRTSMAKGIYRQTFYVGDEIQLADEAPQLTANNEKIDLLTLEVNNLQAQINAIQSAINNKPTLPEIEASTVLAKADEVAGVPAAVRTELATELGRLDVAVSTRSTLTVDDIPEGLTAEDVWTAETRTLTETAGLTPTQAEQLDALTTDVDALGQEVEAVGTAVANVPGAVRTELATELGRIDVAVSTRSTLTVDDIPEGLTAEDVWTAPDRSLTEAAGLTTGQAEQLRKVAQLHGVGVDLVVTETTRTAGDVSQTLTTDGDGNTTVSAA